MIVGNEIIVDPWEVISFYFFFLFSGGGVAGSLAEPKVTMWSTS